MSPLDIPPDLLIKSAPELLNLLTAGKISQEFVGWARQKIKDAFNKKEYGFTPDTQTANALKNVSQSDAYKRMRQCIGQNRYLAVIRIGLRVEELTYDAETDVINHVKNGIYKKYGEEGITILNMGSTGVLLPLIQHLSDVKIENNYTEEQMLKHFLEVVQNWKNITIFHQTDNGKDDLVKKINMHMDAHHEVFFVFAIGMASEQAKKGISTLNNKGIIQKKGYIFRLILRERDRKERDHFAWFFKNIYTFERITL